MKKFSKVIPSILMAIINIIATIAIYFGCNLLFSVVSNYEALSPTVIAGFPMYMFVANLLAFGIYSYRLAFQDKNDPFHKRLYSIIFACFAFVGVVTSILDGTWIYKTFFGDYIFDFYPLVMLIIHSVVLGISIYYFIINQKKIKNEGLVNTHKSDWKHCLKTVGFVFLFLFAENRLGAFLLIPVYYSSYDGYYTIPYLIQLVVPFAIGLCYLLNRKYIKQPKFGLISSAIILGYSIFSFIYMAAIARGVTAPHVVNTISAIQNFERLIKIPADFIILYVFSIAIPLTNIIIIVIKKIRNKLKKNL